MTDIFIAAFGVLCLITTVVTTPKAHVSDDKLTEIENAFDDMKNDDYIKGVIDEF